MNAPAMRVAFNGVAAAAEASGLRLHHIRQALAFSELRGHAVARRRVILRDDLVEFIRRRAAPSRRGAPTMRRALSREQGRIKKWFEGNGYVRTDDGDDIFVHVSSTGFLVPKVGDRVSFGRGSLTSSLRTHASGAGDGGRTS
jgi:cold shock CspA family protein